jgi:hypothetical protein
MIKYDEAFHAFQNQMEGWYFGGGISIIAAAIIAKRMGDEGDPWGRTSEISFGDSILP